MPERGWLMPLARGRTLAIHRPLVMGILNATPDSFSDGGRHATPQALRDAAKAMTSAGADILDVGGESTRPGAIPVSAELELRRVIPAVQAIRRASPEAVISIDTRKAEVAQAALAAGADFVNDVSALSDPAMAEVLLRHGCSVVLMRSAPLVGDLLTAARSEMAELLNRAARSGIPLDRTILDPGLGFGDPPGGSPSANMALLRSVAELSHGRPMLVGASRKRFIGQISGVKDAQFRLGGSVAAAVLAVASGAAIVRVHDVPETVQAVRVAAST